MDDRGKGEVEQEGIRRAWQEIQQADHVIMLVDASEVTGQQYAPNALWPEFVQQLPAHIPLTVVLNKIDLVGSLPEAEINNKVICLSAKTGTGVDALREHLKSAMGYAGEGQGGYHRGDPYTELHFHRFHISVHTP